MLELAKESARSFRERYIGRTMPVLWESKVNDGVYSGLTDNYIRVFTGSSQPLDNTILEVRLVKLYIDGVWGEIIQ